MAVDPHWIGIWLGTWSALVGISGSILMFEDPIDAWLNPRLLRDDHSGRRLPIVR